MGKQRPPSALQGNCAAHQCLCFHCIDCTKPLLPKSEISDMKNLLWLYCPVCVEPGQKPDDRFSRDEAHIMCLNSKDSGETVHMFRFA